jgi:hypothetical protein
MPSDKYIALSFPVMFGLLYFGDDFLASNHNEKISGLIHSLSNSLPYSGRL